MIDKCDSLLVLYHFKQYYELMIKKVVFKTELHRKEAAVADRQYWLGRPPVERLAVVDYLRKQFYGTSVRLQRVARVVERKQR